MPYCSSAEKFVSIVATPQKRAESSAFCGVSSTKRPAVAPTVPRPMIHSDPLKFRRKALRAVSISSVTVALASISFEVRERQDDAAGELDEERLGLRDDRELAVAAAPWLPSASFQVPARKLTVTLPVPSWPLNR